MHDLERFWVVLTEETSRNRVLKFWEGLDSWLVKRRRALQLWQASYAARAQAKGRRPDDHGGSPPNRGSGTGGASASSRRSGGGSSSAPSSRPPANASAAAGTRTSSSNERSRTTGGKFSGQARGSQRTSAPNGRSANGRAPPNRKPGKSPELLKRLREEGRCFRFDVFWTSWSRDSLGGNRTGTSARPETCWHHWV
uniref:Expressed protein n=2 Tax=Schizophyllum commune (strain H4-8 / FGSC 9210) TaxID=578458 RepID=D8PLZ3_SCHCM